MSLPGGRFRLVLTPAGLAAAVLVLSILVHSLALRNAYEIVLSFALFCFLLLFFITGAWGAGRFAELSPQWVTPAPLGARAAGETLISGLDLPVPWFFRLHFVVRGRFFPGGAPEGCRWSAETAVSPGGGPARLVIGFPMSGVFRGESSCRLRDVFGFFSFPCGISTRRTLTIRSAPGSGSSFRIEALSGAEDRSSKSASDEERYYMREYAPGDRFRDINWKSSERINTLITRISPDTREKVNRIEVCFRNYGPVKAGPGDLWLLDRAKAQLVRFLDSAKGAPAKYAFRVRTAEAVRDLNNQDEIEMFLEELAALPFSPAPPAETGPSSAAGGDLYVFSTSCDQGLPAFLLNTARPVFLFFCRPAAPGTPPGERETLYLRDFPAGGFVPPLHWLRPRQHRSGLLKPPVAAGRALIGYAEARW